MNQKFPFKTVLASLLAASLVAISAQAQADLALQNTEPSQNDAPIPRPTNLAGPRPLLVMLDYAGTPNSLTGIDQEIKTVQSVLKDTQVIRDPSGHLLVTAAQSMTTDPLCTEGTSAIVWFSGHAVAEKDSLQLVDADQQFHPLVQLTNALGKAKCTVLLVVDAAADAKLAPQQLPANLSILWPAKPGETAWSSNIKGSYISQAFALVLAAKPGQSWTAQPLEQALQQVMPEVEGKEAPQKQTPWIQTSKPGQTVLVSKK